ncbi:hypothetical protein TDB9533_04795 [Thalassocella blandensis]|nr:hypothetical protein TDB9533_04795 [Thalassocella blandensis]
MAALGETRMEVYSWNQNGKLYLWRYEGNLKNYPSWQLTGDQKGLQPLIELLSLMINENRNVKRTVELPQPGKTELEISGCKSKAVPELKFMLHFEVEEVEDWKVKPFRDSMDIVVNPYAAKGFSESLLQLEKGCNDFSFGYGENQIWFW